MAKIQTKRDPRDQAEAGEGLNPGQQEALTRLIRRIGKSSRPAYQGARSYQPLPEDR